MNKIASHTTKVKNVRAKNPATAPGYSTGYNDAVAGNVYDPPAVINKSRVGYIAGFEAGRARLDFLSHPNTRGGSVSPAEQKAAAARIKKKIAAARNKNPAPKVYTVGNFTIEKRAMKYGPALWVVLSGTNVMHKANTLRDAREYALDESKGSRKTNPVMKPSTVYLVVVCKRGSTTPHGYWTGKAWDTEKGKGYPYGTAEKAEVVGKKCAHELKGNPAFKVGVLSTRPFR